MTEPNPALEVLSFGESLVDFLPNRRGVSLRDVDSFRKVVGGAPTNMALGLARLGCRSALVGKIGDDEFGAFVLETLRDAGVDVEGVACTDEAKTGLTFVTLDDDGDRSFLFYRDPSADMLLRPDDVDPTVLSRAEIFQVGSNLLTDPAVREATVYAMECARDADCAISVDPNIRVHLWSAPEEARRAVLEQCEGASILKLNEEELEILAPGTSPAEAWRETFRPRGVDIFVVTLGPEGALLYSPRGEAEVDAPSADVVDTTGAGDGFMSGFLAGLAARLRTADTDEPWRDAMAELPIDVLRDALEIGTTVGTRVCTDLGATPPLPTVDELSEPIADKLRT